MKEFKWKRVSEKQEKIVRTINRFVLLYLMAKLLYKDTSNIEQETYSLDVEDFSLYENYYNQYIKNYWLTDKKVKQEDLLQNQNEVQFLLEYFNSDKKKVNKKKLKEYKKIFFEKFDEYVKLKDLHAQNSYWLCFLVGFCLTSMFIFIIIMMNITKKYSEQELYITIFMCSSFIFSIFGFLFYRAFDNKSKSLWLNLKRINRTLCLEELDKTQRELENYIGKTMDPYAEMPYEKVFKIFQNRYPVVDNFVEELKKIIFQTESGKCEINIIDEYGLVNKQFKRMLLFYLGKIEKEKFKNTEVDWQLIEHVLQFNLQSPTKKKYYKEPYERNKEKQKYLKFCKRLPELKK